MEIHALGPKKAPGTRIRVKQSNISAYGIGGYCHIGLTRSNGMGGGISLLISDKFVFCELFEYSMLTEHIECL